MITFFYLAYSQMRKSKFVNVGGHCVQQAC